MADELYLTPRDAFSGASINIRPVVDNAMLRKVMDCLKSIDELPLLYLVSFLHTISAIASSSRYQL